MKIPIKGIIVANDEKMIYEWFGYEVTTPGDVNNLIEKANGEELEVIINSPGGDAYSGSEIYSSLMDYNRLVTVKIVGIAGSAAGVIAMAGGITKISPTAQIMIHNVSGGVRGDYRVFEHEAEVLKNYNKSIANAYILKTGMAESELLKMMNKETWLTAQKAKELGFADEIMFDVGNKLAASAGQSTMLPQTVIDKVRNHIIKEKEAADKTRELEVHKAKARLNLLKLKEVVL